MRSRLLGATMLGGALALTAGALSACGGDDEGGAPPETLPPIVTLPTTAPTTAAPSTTTPQYYEVQRGDTLFQIADAYGLPMPAIMELNEIENPDDIQAGQILQLPPRSIVATSLPAVPSTSTSTTAAP